MCVLDHTLFILPLNQDGSSDYHWGMWACQMRFFPQEVTKRGLDMSKVCGQANQDNQFWRRVSYFLLEFVVQQKPIVLLFTRLVPEKSGTGQSRPEHIWPTSVDLCVSRTIMTRKLQRAHEHAHRPGKLILFQDSG